MIDKHEWQALETRDGARVMSGCRTICRIAECDYLEMTAMEAAREIADLHNQALIEITAGALALAQQ
jgi:hypothetical protein